MRGLELFSLCFHNHQLFMRLLTGGNSQTLQSDVCGVCRYDVRIPVLSEYHLFVHVVITFVCTALSTNPSIIAATASVGHNVKTFFAVQKTLYTQLLIIFQSLSCGTVCCWNKNEFFQHLIFSGLIATRRQKDSAYQPVYHKKRLQAFNCQSLIYFRQKYPIIMEIQLWGRVSRANRIIYYANVLSETEIVDSSRFIAFRSTFFGIKPPTAVNVLLFTCQEL